MSFEWEVKNGDCRREMASMEESSIDAIVTDPPYGLGKQPSPTEMATILSSWMDPNSEDQTLSGGGFMGEEWDSFVPAPSIWREAIRVLKPGGHALVFAGSRTQDLMGLSLRLAGFEIVDTIQWLYGSGFPKGANIGKMIDRTRDDEEEIRFVCRGLREAIEASEHTFQSIADHFGYTKSMIKNHWAAKDSHTQPQCPRVEQWEILEDLVGPFDEELTEMVHYLNDRKGQPGETYKEREVLDEMTQIVFRPGQDREHATGKIVGESKDSTAQKWEGYRTQLKPAYEPVIVARKPIEGTYADNCVRYGVGAFNIDGCRIPWREEADKEEGRPGSFGRDREGFAFKALKNRRDWNPKEVQCDEGRFPTNVIMDEEAARMLDEQTGIQKSGSIRGSSGGKGIVFSGLGAQPDYTFPANSGGASRFFYVAKASRSEREFGLDDFEERERDNVYGDGFNAATKLNTEEQIRTGKATNRTKRKNVHPTVKPVDLMRYLIDLVRGPDGGTILDPFCGSGTTGIAAFLSRGGNADPSWEPVSFIGIEMNPLYAKIARQRIDAHVGDKPILNLFM